jgi:hypothetical protein
MATSQVLGPQNALVIEGLTDDLVTALKKSSGLRGIAIAVPDERKSLAFLDLVRQISELYPEILKEREQRTLRSIMDALIPSAPVPSAALAQALMNAEARAEVLKSGDFITAAEVAKLAGYSTNNPSQQPIKWKQDRLIFALLHKGMNYFPLYALNPDDNYRPYKAVAKVLDIFGPAISNWAIASWFLSLNSFLDDRTPKDLLASDPEIVIKAAQDQMDEMNHV